METSDDDIALVPLTSGQTEQFARLEEIWPEYGHSLQVSAAASGGMGWRTVDGIEYLTRYAQVDGRKTANSLGRRNPKTEAQYAHFENTTLKARRILREHRDEVALICRLAKAHGVARLHGKFAETLDWLWHTDANRRVALFGGSALFAYESGSKILAPADLIKESHLQFISHSDDPVKMGLAEIGEACGADESGGQVTVERGRFVIRADGVVVAEIFPPSYFLRRLERGPAKTLREGFEMPWLRSLAFSRDSRPIELCAPDPRIYALAAYCLKDDDDIWARRAEFAAEMVRERWPDKFDEHQEIVLDGLPGRGDRRLGGP